MTVGSPGSAKSDIRGISIIRGYPDVANGRAEGPDPLAQSGLRLLRQPKSPAFSAGLF